MEFSLQFTINKKKKSKISVVRGEETLLDIILCFSTKSVVEVKTMISTVYFQSK